MSASVLKQSRHSFSETVSRLSEALVDAGNTVFAVIDQSAAAAGVGLALRPTSLIIFGNPRGGTPLMNDFPSVTLDLPLKLAVWEAAATITVAYTPMSEITKRHGITGHDQQIAAIDQALDALTASIT